MGYDRQSSPFATRLLLTCYCLFLLVNVLLYANNVYRLKKTKLDAEYEIETVLLGVLAVSLFSTIVYGLWFARIAVLCFAVLLFSMLLGTSFISFILLATDLLVVNAGVFASLSNSLYFAHNYLLLVMLRYEIGLSISCALNVLALWGTCHLCSCIEHRHHSWPYRKRQLCLSQTII